MDRQRWQQVGRGGSVRWGNKQRAACRERGGKGGVRKEAALSCARNNGTVNGTVNTNADSTSPKTTTNIIVVTTKVKITTTTTSININDHHNRHHQPQPPQTAYHTTKQTNGTVNTHQSWVRSFEPQIRIRTCSGHSQRRDCQNNDGTVNSTTRSHAGSIRTCSGHSPPKTAPFRRSRPSPRAEGRTRRCTGRVCGGRAERETKHNAQGKTKAGFVNTT